MTTETVPTPKVYPDLEETPLLSANTNIYKNTRGSETHFSRVLLKSAAYLETQAPNEKSLFSENQFKTLNKGCVILERGPYTDEELKLLHENYRREGATRAALDFVAQAVLGKRTDLVMAPTKGFASAQREEEQIQELNEDTANLDLLDELATIDRDVNLNDRMTELLVSAKNFGRAVQVIIRDEDGIPTALIPLASMKLGKIYLTHDWQFLGCEYKDYQGDKRILRAEDIIHFENSDYHITPNMRYFGLSQMEPVMYVASSLRVSLEIAGPEIHKSMWAPAQDIYVPGAKDQTTLDSVAADIQPGKRWVHNYQATVTTIKPEIDLDHFEKSVEARTKLIFRAAGVPLIVAFQDEQNRSTAQAAIAINEETRVTKERTRLRNTMEPQWYIPNLKALIKKKQKKQFGPLAPYAEEGLLPALERSANILQIDVEAAGLPFYPKMQFIPLTVDSYLEKTAATLEWLNAGALTIPEALEVGGLDKYKEAAQAREEEKRQLKEQSMLVTEEPTPESKSEGPSLIESKLDNLRNPETGPPVSKGLPRAASAPSPEQKREQELREELLTTKIQAAKEFREAIRELRNVS